MLGRFRDLNEYRGAVIASKDKLFFVFDEDRGANRAIAEFQRSVSAQPLLNTDTSAESSRKVIHTEYDQLAAEITQDESWPVGFYADRVIIIPKENIVNFKWSRLIGLKIFVADAAYICRIGMFGFGKAKDKLRRLGWPIPQ